MRAGRPDWARAAAFAARAHEGQFRWDARTPYVSHPFRVAMTLRHVYGCEDETALCAAMLHDCIEDTTADFDEIESHFGIEVARVVASLTKNKALREDEREPEYDARLARAGWRAKIIKLADVYDNLSGLDGDGAWRGGTAKDRARMVEKCHRAITLARDWDGESGLLERALHALRAKMRTRARGR